MSPEYYVVDANVFIHGSTRQLPFDHIMVVPEITAELESTEAQNRFDTSDVEIREPTDETVAELKAFVDEENLSLSDTDIRLLALAADQDAVIVTDDKFIQTAAAKRGIRYQGFLQDEIDEPKDWKLVCRNCRNEIDAETCPYCGGDAMRVTA